MHQLCRTAPSTNGDFVRYAFFRFYWQHYYAVRSLPCAQMMRCDFRDHTSIIVRLPVDVLATRNWAIEAPNSIPSPGLTRYSLAEFCYRIHLTRNTWIGGKSR